MNLDSKKAKENVKLPEDKSKDYLDHEDEDELDRFESRQTKFRMQQKRRKAAGAP
jgi:hypothetical protein